MFFETPSYSRLCESRKKGRSTGLYCSTSSSGEQQQLSEVKKSIDWMDGHGEKNIYLKYCQYSTIIRIYSIYTMRTKKCGRH